MRRTGLTLAAILFVLLSATVALGWKTFPQKHAKPPCLVWIGTTGKSMLPKYQERTLAELDVAFPFDRLAIGDEVVFWNATRAGGHVYLLHPIIARNGDAFVTQGLNPETNPRPDETPLTRANYIGKATGRRTYLLTPPEGD